MSPTNKETADLIRRVSGITSINIPPQAAMPKGGQDGQQRQYSVPTYNPETLRAQTEQGQDLASQIAQGGMNAVGYAFRLITGLGRGMTNLAGGVLPHANAIWDTYKDGFQVEDIPKSLEEGGKGFVAGIGGLLSGIAVSGVPQIESAIEEATGREVYEFGSDLFKSKDFSKAMENLRAANVPVGNLGTEKANEKVFNIPTPFGDFGLSENELWGLGWDVATDPTTYATMGLLGAVKGASRGISATTAYAKAGKPANFADVAPKALPRPFYTGANLDKKGRKAFRNTPIANPTYTVANTSPLTYIAKEMGRGFMEAHRARLNHVSSKTSAIQAVTALNRKAAESMIGKGDEVTQEFVENIVALNREEILSNQRALLAKQGITSAMEQERILAETSAALDAQVKDIVAQAPQWKALFSSEEAAAELARLAKENGIDIIEEGAMQIADRTARGLRRTTPAIPRKQPEKIKSDEALKFGRAMESASDPKTGSANFGEIWDSFKGGSPKTVKEVFRAMVEPIGYRERPAMSAKAAKQAAMTENQDIIEAVYGSGLRVTASKNRTPVSDMKAVDEVIPGTGKTRRTYVKTGSKELRQLMKAVRMAKDTRQGAGSKLTASKKITINTPEDIENAPKEFLVNLTKNFYTDVIMPANPSAKAWDKLTTGQKGKITEQILNDPTVITADIFNKSIVSPTVMAARVSFLGERSIAAATKEYNKINWFKSQRYNPLTAAARHPKVRDFAFSQDELKEGGISFIEATKLMLTLSGRVQDRDLNKTLRKLNVKIDSLYEGGELMNLSRIEEVLHQAHIAVIAKKSKDFKAKLKAENTGELGAENLVDPNLLNADPEALLGQHITDLTTKGVLATEEEIVEAISRLDLIQTAQKEAGEKLEALGFDWMGVGKPAFLVLSRLESPTAFKAGSTESKIFSEIKSILKAPKERPGQPVLQKEYFLPTIKKLEEIKKIPVTTETTKDAINKIIRIMTETSDGEMITATTKLDTEGLRDVFARVGNIVKQLDDRVQRGTTVGFDTVFARKGGEYDQQAFIPFLEEAYRASRTQDSPDGGYFANKIDQMISANNKDAKPLYLQTPEEVKQSIRSLGQWRGEGVSAGLLHAIVRSTGKQAVKKKAVPLSPEMEADIKRVYDSLYNKMVDDVLAEDEAIYRAETMKSDVVTEDPGVGNMQKVVTEKLDETEIGIYNKITLGKKLMPVSENTKKDLEKLAEAIADANAKGAGIKLQRPKVSRGEQELGVIPIKDMEIGDSFEYKDILALSLNLDRELKSLKTADQNNLKNWQESTRRLEDAKADFSNGKITEEEFKIIEAESAKIEKTIRYRFGTAAERTESIITVWQKAKGLSQKGISMTEKKAGDAIARYRAEKEIFARFPSFADSGTMIRAAEKIPNRTKAAVNWRARVWLATFIDEADRGIRAREVQNGVMKRLQNKEAKGIDALKEEQKEFNDILAKIETKLRKEYTATTVDVTKMSVDEIIASENYLDLIRKIRVMQVIDGKQEGEWEIAMDALLNLQIVGKGSRYESFSELAKTYKTARRDMKPGDENPETKKQIPTDKEVLEILLTMGGSISERAAEFLKKPTVKRTDVLTLLRRLDKDIAKEDLAKAKALDFISSTNIAGGAQVRYVADTLGPDKVVQQEILNQLNLEVVKLYDEGLDFIPYLASVSLGKSNKQYFGTRAKELKQSETDALGRAIDVDKPSPNYDRKAFKKTYETTSVLYTGWKSTVAALSKMAEEKGLEGAARQAFMTQNAMRVLRLRDLMLHVEGIFPASTLELKKQEQKYLGFNVHTPEEIAGLSKPVYLTDADVLDIYPQDVIGAMLFVGRDASMPVTSFLAPARLIVSAVDNLPPGAQFTEEQLSALKDRMVALMINNAIHANTREGGKGLSHVAANEKFQQNVEIAVSWMLKPSSAQKLFEQHVINAAIATKVYKYQSAEVTADITKAMLKMLQSPLASTGSKIQAIIDSSEAIRNLTGRGDLSPEVLFQAELDLNTVLASQLDLDSANVAQAALKMEQSAQEASAQAKLKSQIKAANGDHVKRMNQIRLDLDRQRGDLYNNLAALRNLEEVKKAPEVEKDDPFDVFNDHLTSDVQIRRSLKYADATLGRLFYDYGMQTMRKYTGGLERRRVDAVTTFEVIAGNMNKKWQTAHPDRNILGDAFKIIQKVPDDVLDNALEARSRLLDAVANKKKTQEAKLTPEEYADLMAESRLLDSYLKLDDRALNEAVIELWALSGRIFGGGEKSMIKLDGITPQWINKNLRETGGGNRVGFIDENGNYTQVKDGYGFTTLDSMGDIWREWDITNPVEMIVTLNAALSKAGIVPSIADSAVKNFGVPKANYKTLADAKADGLVAIKTVPTLSQGRELLHFMDTENYYFPVQIAQELGKLSKQITEIKYIQAKGAVEKVLQKFNVLTNVTKQVMTIWTLKNYLQNWVGGIFSNGLGGVVSPFAYGRAAKLLKTSGRNLKDVDLSALDVQLARYEAIKGQEGFVIKEASDPRKSNSMEMTVKGRKVAISYGDLEKLANKHGLYVPVAQSREYDLVEEFSGITALSKAKTVLQKIRSAYDKPTFWLSKRAAERDDFLRATLWLDIMSKENWVSLDKAAQEAMTIVNRYHPQVQELSTFLSKYARPFVMFFTWRAKMLGTILGDLLDKPGPIVNTVRATQAFNNSQEESQSNAFGNLTPLSAPLPSYFKHNLDPIAVDPETGLMSKFSVANPVTDLLGSAGWLSGIDFNSYEPFQDQLIDLSLDTMNRLTWQSAPFVLKELANLPQGRTSSGTTDFMDGGFNTSEDAPAAVQDLMNNLGFGVFHTTAATMFGGVFLNARMKNMNEDQRMAEFQRAWRNYLSGMKVTPLDTIDNRKRGMQELLAKIDAIR